ncbi:hypothetical protein AVEN_64165-1, partial [Araneus ventricosus]
QLHGRPALCVKYVEDQMYYNWCGIKIWRVRPAQVLSSWSDRGSKLRGPSQNSPDVPSKQDVNLNKIQRVHTYRGPIANF